MSETEEEKAVEKSTSYWPLVGFIALVLLLWTGNLFLLRPFEPELRGQFGDMFGAVNALFSGLAFSGLIYTIILQRKELELQRLELRATRKEMAGQRQELKNQNEWMKKQTFETSFFNVHKAVQNIKGDFEVLLSDYYQSAQTKLADLSKQNWITRSRELTSPEVSIVIEYMYNQWGTRNHPERQALESDIKLIGKVEAVSRKVLSKTNPKHFLDLAYQSDVPNLTRTVTNQLYTGMNIEEKLGLMNHSYHELIGKKGLVIEPYFKMMYNILSLIDNADIDNKNFYVSVTLGFFSRHELALLYFNCISSFGSKSFMSLVEKYKVLEGLRLNDLSMVLQEEATDKDRIWEQAFSLAV